MGSGLFYCSKNVIFFHLTLTGSCDSMVFKMAAFMEVGDIWQYGIDDQPTNYFICMGSGYYVLGKCWILYRVLDTDFKQKFEYPDETFQKVVENKTMTLISRVSKNA